MNKEEIKHFKAILRQGILRHKNILLDDKFQQELLNIIKEYENIKQENKQLKNRTDKAIEYIEKESAFLNDDEYEMLNKKELLEILKGKSE